jgi:isocitrate/isopropylmalate dehydrogenase
MAKYRIAWMPGDGIGVDVMDAARLVLDKLALDAEYPRADIGWHFWRTEGDPLPQRTLDLLQTCNCALFGAITSKPRDEAAAELIPALQGKGFEYRSPIVRLRQAFDLYVNLRPCKAYAGNPLNTRDNIDLVVFRENTEGMYGGVEYHPLPDELRAALTKHNSRMDRYKDVPADEIAVTLRIITQQGARRIVRAAFEYAQKFGYPTVTISEKPNVLRETSGLMVRAAREVAQEYPAITLQETNIDAQMVLVLRNPTDYGVLVTSNMFGDILSDLTAELVGGLGFAPSANIGDRFAVFEPTHGSAPSLAGKYTANPMAMLITVKLMLDWLGESDKAAALDTAIADIIQAGTVRTFDLGGTASTLEVAEAVAARL